MKLSLDKVLIRKAKKDDLNEIKKLVRNEFHKAAQIPFAKHVLNQLHVQVRGKLSNCLYF